MKVFLDANVIFSAAQAGSLARILVETVDEHVLGAAIAAHCDYLVTGDRTHFGALYGRTICSVVICSPREFAEVVRARGWFE